MSAPSTVFVLGSGRSVLDLTDDERAHLAAHPCVAMNKYLLFWERAGIFPSHYFLADIHYPAMRVYEESVAIAQADGRPVHFLLDDAYRMRYGDGAFKRLRNWPFQIDTRRKHGFQYDPARVPTNATYFRRPHRWDAPRHWATSLDEPMFFHRGSLTVLINLLTVLRIAPAIKLVGVDLATPDSFFDEALEERPYLVDQYMRLQREGPEPRHMTAREFQGMPGIQDAWPFVQEQVEAAGMALSCCNPNSLLVTEGLCPFADVME